MVDFVSLFNAKNKEACLALISTLSEEQTSLSQRTEILDSLKLAIEKNFDCDVFIACIDILPESIYEDFFSRFGGLLKFLDNVSLDSKVRSDILAKVIVSSFLLSREDLNELSLKILPDKLGEILLNLHHQLTTANQKLPTLQLKYDVLIIAFCIHSIENFELIKNNPLLTSLVFINRMNLISNEEEKQQLIEEICFKGEYCDWQEPEFKKLIAEKLVEVFVSIGSENSEKMVSLFSQYADLKHERAPSSEDIIRLLDDYYLQSSNDKGLLASIEAVGKHDPGFSLMFLTKTGLEHFPGYEIIQKIPFENLFDFGATIFILSNQFDRYRPRLCDDFIKVVCLHFEVDNNEFILSEMAKAFSGNVPIQILEKLDEGVKNFWHNKPELYSKWLSAALKSNNFQGKSIIVASCCKFCISYSEKQILALLKDLPTEHLIQLYELLSKEQAQEKADKIYIALFSDENRHAQLVSFLVTFPNPGSALLKFATDSLESKSLLLLIFNLLDPDRGFLNKTLEQVLLLFCRRLSNAGEKDPIHTWNDDLNDNLAEPLILKVLEIPECIYELSITNNNSFSSRLYSYISKPSIPTALALRIDKFMSTFKLSAEKINPIALNLLLYFQNESQKLQDIFTNMYASNILTKVTGVENLKNLQLACLNFLNDTKELNEEQNKDIAEINDLFLTALTGKAAFDSFRQAQALREFEKNNPAKAAELIALTTTPLPRSFPDNYLPGLLLCSASEDTLCNWQKAKDFLNNSSLPYNRTFFTQLIAQAIAGPATLPISLQVYRLLSESPYFEALLPSLPESHWLWLVKNKGDLELQPIFTHWVPLILKENDPGNFNLGKLLTSFPFDSDSLDTLLVREIFLDPKTIASLYLQIAEEDHNDHWLTYLHEKIIEWDKAQIQIFIAHVHSTIKPEQVTERAIHVLNTLVLYWSRQLDRHNPQDIKSIEDQLALIYSAKNTLGHEGLSQFVHNLLLSLKDRDSNLFRYLIKTEAVGDALLSILQALGNEKAKAHSLIQEILENGLMDLAPRLKEAPLFQDFLLSLLQKPDLNWNQDKYLLLFDQLLPINQKCLAEEMFKAGRNRYPVQEDLLTQFGKILTLQELFEFFEQNKKDFPIIEAMVVHPQRLASLDSIKKIKLISGIDSDRQILKILNGFNTPVQRNEFTHIIFEVCENNGQELSKKLAQWHVGPELIAMLAEYTLNPADKKLLQEVVVKNSSYKSALDNYLLQYNQKKSIQKRSFLQDWLELTAVNPWEGHFCSAQLAQELPSDILSRALKNHLDFCEQFKSFEDLLQPTRDYQKSALISAFTGARWFHQLMLGGEGLLPLIAYYLKAPKELQLQMAKTQVFQCIVDPLLSSKGISTYWVGQDALDAFSRQFEFPQLKMLLQRYDQKLLLINRFVSSKMLEYFSAKPVLDDLNFMEKASNHFSNSNKNLAIQPVQQFRDWLLKALSDTRLAKDSKFHQWFFFQALLSPFTETIEIKYISAFLHQISIEDLLAKLDVFYEIQKNSAFALDAFIPLAKKPGLSEAIDYLYTLDVSELKNSAAAAKQANLTILSDLANFALGMKQANLSLVQAYQLLPSQIDADLMGWVNQDLDKIESYKLFLQTRFDQLLKTGLYYHPDNNNEARLQFLEKEFISVQQRASCLNSYRPVFGLQGGAGESFLLILNQLLLQHKVEKENLPADFIGVIIEAALKKPEQHQQLCQQLSEHLDFRLLQRRWSRILPNQSTHDLLPPPEELIKALAASSPEKEAEFTALLRLSFLNNPDQDLKTASFFFSNLEASLSFIADIGLYGLFLSLSESDKKWDLGLQWLVDQAQNNPFSYLSQIDAFIFQTRNHSAKIVCYTLLWKNQLFANSERLIDGFLHWLSQQEEQSLARVSGMEFLWQYLHKEKLITAVCRRVVEAQSLNTEQLNWLYGGILQLDSNYKRLIPSDILEKIMPDPFESLKEQVKNIDFANRSVANPAEFFQKLNTLTPENLNELRNAIKEDRLLSLLNIYLLSTPIFVNALQGDSFLEQIKAETHKVSRLQALILNIKQEQLTPELISRLTPEAAASLLCSVKHFYHLDYSQAVELLKRLPDSQAFFQYWLKNYSTLPNAVVTCVHLLKAMEFKYSMDSSSKNILLDEIIRNAKAFKEFTDFEWIVKEAEEKHILRVLQFSNEGHKFPFLKGFIKKYVKTRPLSDESAKLLMSLPKLESYIDPQCIAEYKNNFLRKYAHRQDVSLFSDGGQLNINRIQNPVIRAEQENKPPEAKASWFSFGTVAKENVAPEEEISVVENPVMTEKMKKKPVQAIDYYLSHFSGDALQLEPLLNDYLFSCKTNLRSTFKLMTTQGVPEKVQKAIFQAFIKNPALHDDSMKEDLFTRDTPGFIKFYVNEQQYSALKDFIAKRIESKNYSNSQMDDPEKSRQYLEEIKKEVDCEGRISQMSGFFKPVLAWFARARTYGLTWFNPKPPKHLPDYNENQRVPAKANSDQKIFISAVDQLKAALKTGNHLEIHKALVRYNIEAPQTSKSQNLRLEVEQNYQKFLGLQGKDLELKLWLKENRQAFLENKSYLLESYLRTDFNTFSNSLRASDPDYFSALHREFDPPEIKLKDSLEVASKETRGWIPSFLGGGKSTSEVVEPKAKNAGWLSGLWGGEKPPAPVTTAEEILIQPRG